MRYVVALLLTTLCVHGAINETNAVRAIIGEAANQPLRTQIAVACAIRNRGTLNGVLGLKNWRMINRQTAKTFNTARQAWACSTNDISGGATHFADNNLPDPWWSVNMVVTTNIGCFKFYKNK